MGVQRPVCCVVLGVIEILLFHVKLRPSTICVHCTSVYCGCGFSSAYFLGDCQVEYRGLETGLNAPTPTPPIQVKCAVVCHEKKVDPLKNKMTLFCLYVNFWQGIQYKIWGWGGGGETGLRALYAQQIASFKKGSVANETSHL